MARYSYTITHKGLGKQRTVSGRNKREAKYKANLVMQNWNEQYAKKLEREQLRLDRENVKHQKEQAKELAFEKTREAELKQEALTDLLLCQLSVKSLDWKNVFGVNDLYSQKPKKPLYQELLEEPKRDDFKYADRSLLGRLSKKTAAKNKEEYNKNFEQDHIEWEKITDSTKK